MNAIEKLAEVVVWMWENDTDLLSKEMEKRSGARSSNFIHQLLTTNVLRIVGEAGPSGTASIYGVNLVWMQMMFKLLRPLPRILTPPQWQAMKNAVLESIRFQDRQRERKPTDTGRTAKHLAQFKEQRLKRDQPLPVTPKIEATIRYLEIMDNPSWQSHHDMVHGIKQKIKNVKISETYINDMCRLLRFSGLLALSIREAGRFYYKRMPKFSYREAVNLYVTYDFESRRYTSVDRYGEELLLQARVAAKKFKLHELRLQVIHKNRVFLEMFV